MCLLETRHDINHNIEMIYVSFSPFSIPQLLQDVGLIFLLLSGDVESNPGPPTGRRSVAQGPSTDEQVYTLNSQVSY